MNCSAKQKIVIIARAQPLKSKKRAENKNTLPKEGGGAYKEKGLEKKRGKTIKRCPAREKPKDHYHAGKKKMRVKQACGSEKDNGGETKGTLPKDGYPQTQ